MCKWKWGITIILTGKSKGAACNKYNINCKQKNSSFIPIFCHNYSGYDCHLMFEELSIQSKIWNNNISKNNGKLCICTFWMFQIF